MGKALKGIRMAILTLAIFIKEKHTLKEFISGQTVAFTMVNGTMVSSMVTVFGKEFKMTLILESGRKPNAMVLEFTFGQTVISTKVHGRIL